MACRECMYENILQQKQAIKHEQKMIDLKNQESEQQKQLEELEAKRVILDTFDKTQHSMLGGERRRPTIKDDLKDNTLPAAAVTEGEKKRKRSDVDADEIAKTAAQLKKEKEEAAKPKIGSFWVVNMEMMSFVDCMLLSGRERKRERLTHLGNSLPLHLLLMPLF